MKRRLEPFSKVLLISLLWFNGPSVIRADVSIAYPTDHPQLNFAVSKLQHALRLANETCTFRDLAEPGDRDILILTDEKQAVFLPDSVAGTRISRRIKDEGFQIAQFRFANKDILCIFAHDETGAMYGTLDLAEQIQVTNDLSHVEEKLSNPRFEFRAIKFNLPWSSYRPSENPAMSLHVETCRSLDFWQRFLDMMAENLFNVLSLWNLHPFTYMIRPKDFPEACPFSDTELAQWQRFWQPKPENYRIAWIIRNDDFFVLHWGQPDFIRKHIEINGRDYVGGYFIGSEGYIPAKEYAHKLDQHVTWQYAFEKQWLFYKLWGRLLYDPNTPDKVFKAEFDRRYGNDVGDKLLEAYALASRMPLRLASFHRATWDYTLYSEGFLAPAQTGFNDKVSSFISIDELIKHETLDSMYVSIPDYVKAVISDKSINESLLTPLELTDDLEKDGTKALELVEGLRDKAKQNTQTLICEIADVQAWAYLSLYFADKLRAGVALEMFHKTKVKEQQSKSVALLECAATHWAKLVEITKQHYDPVPAVQLSRSQKETDAVFSWERYSGQVQRDIQIAEAAK